MCTNGHDFSKRTKNVGAWRQFVFEYNPEIAFFCMYDFVRMYDRNPEKNTTQMAIESCCRKLSMYEVHLWNLIRYCSGSILLRPEDVL